MRHRPISIDYRHLSETRNPHPCRFSHERRGLVSLHPRPIRFRQSSSRLSDPGTKEFGVASLDPAIPEVFDHRMRIFTEVAQNYDIDGLELDFRRWYFMISDPLKNHTVLTEMVRQIRKMLHETAKAKGREPMLLGVRVSPMLRGTFDIADFPGAHYGEPENLSCQNLGLDVKTWIQEGLVDYICPTLFLSELPGLPRTNEFVALARNTPVGVYPTLFDVPNGATTIKTLELTNCHSKNCISLWLAIATIFVMPP